MIQDIVNSINDTLSNCLGVEDSVFYNIAQVIEINNKRYPVTASDGKVIKICPNDAYNLQVYHRIESHSFEQRKDLSFGREMTYAINSSAKMIVIMKSALSQVNPNYIPENFGLLISQSVKLTDYNSIKTNIKSVTTDHDSVVRREWKEIDYTKHKCKFLVFEVNYNIRAITCKLECTRFLLLEDMYKLLQENSSAILLE